MKLIVVGCGSIGRRHARNAAKLGMDVSLCDVSEARLRELAPEVNATAVFTDWVEAARRSGADAALIATPSYLHLEPATAMLRAGKHVMMEKPLCPSAKEARQFKPEVEASGRIFMMAHTFRFRSEWQTVKQILDSHPIGRVTSAEFMGGWWLPDWHFREDYRTEYAAQRRQGGGAMLTSMSHFFDVVAWFFGNIGEVVGARMRLGLHDLDVDDAVACTVRTSSGVVVTLWEDFLSRCPRRTLRVNGEYGYMEVDFHRRSLRVWDARTKRHVPIASESKDATLFRILEDGVGYDMDPEVSFLDYSGNDAYLAELAHFAALIEGRTSCEQLGIDAGIRVLDAMESVGIVDWTDMEE